MAKIKTKTDYIQEFAETLAQRLNQSYMQELSLSYWEGMEDPQQRRFCADQLQLLEDGFGYGYDFRVEMLQHHFRIIYDDRASSARRIHALVCKLTGDVFPPGRDVSKYNLLDGDSRRECLSNCHWFKPYL
ncbi:hypothetical protein [Synechococcus phage S-B68]|nr:hypothetical protein [Synechococcus phage S-B68]